MPETKRENGKGETKKENGKGLAEVMVVEAWRDAAAMEGNGGEEAMELKPRQGDDQNDDTPDEGGDEEQHSGCCCGSPSCTCCKIFLKYTVGRSIQLAFYILDILTDVAVAVADFRAGDQTFAYLTLGFVFAPGLLYSLFAVTEVLANNTGLLVCLKAPLWLVSFPILPLWPIARDLRQIYHGVMALFPSNRKQHLEFLNRPSRAYLVKFLEAFAESAPQLLLRLYKVTIRSNHMQFTQFETLEVVQISFSLWTLTTKIISTHQKNVTTAQIIEGDMEDNERFRLPCYVQVMAMLWWAGFLVARFQAMALFAGSLHYWIFLVVGIHVVLVFVFQTIARGKNRLKRIFIYLFSAFVFIFAYLEFNMKTRLKVSAWFPYTVYAVLVFLENSVMLVLWYMTQLNLASVLPAEEQAAYTQHRKTLIFIHYGSFCFGLVMMILTFVCARTSGDKEEEQKNDNNT